MVKKAIVAIAGLGTRFLPLSKVIPKELWPLVDKPIIQYLLEEILDSGIKEVIFVTRPGECLTLDYFQKKLKSKKIFYSRYKSHFLEDLKKLEEISKKIKFWRVVQKEPLGSAHAVLQAEKLLKKEPCAVLWADDVIQSKIPCLKQLIQIFEKYKSPIIALSQVSKESVQFYGIIKGKKINAKIYKIEDFIEKPSIKEAPSRLAIVGRYIITPEIFEQLKKTHFDIKSDITLSQTVVELAKKGKNVYGYKFEGKWLECGNKVAYLKSNFYLSLVHPKFGKELKNLK
jgi:UTP--glucose-1-phosphate uridylyltransferase